MRQDCARFLDEMAEAMREGDILTAGRRGANLVAERFRETPVICGNGNSASLLNRVSAAVSLGAAGKALAGQGEKSLREIVEGLKAGALTLPVMREAATPLLHAALDWGNAEAVDLLLRCGADPEVPCEDGVFPLHRAVQRGLVRVVCQLTAHGANPNRPDAEGRTPLDHAFASGVSHLVRMLLIAGATYRGSAEPGELLAAAARAGSVNGIREIVDLGADPNFPVGPDRQVAAHAAVLSGKPEAFAAVLDAQGAWGILDAHGQSPLDLALACPNALEMVLPLLQVLYPEVCFSPLGLDGQLRKDLENLLDDRPGAGEFIERMDRIVQDWRYAHDDAFSRDPAF